MIQAASTIHSLVNQLSADFIVDKKPLVTYAGFANTSPHAGQARQTLSLILSESTIKAIRQQVQGLYDELIRDCWPDGEVIPFDMVRFDAFLDPISDDIKIIEMNTRNVGLHEVVEWLDQTVATAIGVPTVGSLNQRFVENQKLLHSSLFGEDVPLLYMSPDFLPRWTYYEELLKAYTNVKHITEPQADQQTPDGVEVDGVVYQAITKKMAWPASPHLKQLDLDNAARLLQPRWMRQFGLKNYLQRLSSPTILRTETFSPRHVAQYQQNKDQLVLKIIDGGNSKAVYLGGLCDDEDWQRKLTEASQRPEKWILQDYYQPPLHSVAAHGIGPKILPIQLGIFVLPSPSDPTQFDMDITIKGYAGKSQHFTFDPSGLNPDIWFGHVIKVTS